MYARDDVSALCFDSAPATVKKNTFRKCTYREMQKKLVLSKKLIINLCFIINKPFIRYPLLPNICLLTHTHTLPRECIAKPLSQMALVIRSTGDQPVAFRINMLFFTHTTRGQSWIELTAWGDFQNHFHLLSFAFKHTIHKQIWMEKCCLWFVWCMYTRWTKNNYSISPFVIVFA